MMGFRGLGGVAPIILLAACSQPATNEPAPEATATSESASGPLAFDHFMTAISVADMAAETAFFVDKLGFTVSRDAEMRDGAIKFRWLTNGNERIELVQSEGSKAPADRPPPPGHAAVQGFTHVTLATHDIDAVKAALVANGVTPVLDITEIAGLGIKVMYVTDPEGNAIEIAQELLATDATGQDDKDGDG